MTLAIADLSFYEPNDTNTVKGGTILTGPTPTVSTALATGADTRTTFDSLVTGDVLGGYQVFLFANSGASGAAAASTSIGGQSTANIFVQA